MNGIIPTTSTFQKNRRREFITSPWRTANGLRRFEANGTDGFHAIRDFCQDSLETLLSSAANSKGANSRVQVFLGTGTE
jgi:hypothetical protein